MSKEYKTEDDLPDLYMILGLTCDVCNKENCDEIIRSAYLKKAKLCHPDKHPGRKDVEEVFELLTNAYDILKDESQRTAYNYKLKLTKKISGGFLKLKKNFSDVPIFNQNHEITNEQHNLFQQKMKQLDEMNGFNRSESAMGQIPVNDARKKLNNLNKKRINQEEIYKPEKLFDEDDFNLKKFNAIFDHIKKNNEESTMVKHQVPREWNWENDRNFSSFENSFDDPVKISKNDVLNLSEATYVSNHNNLEEDYYKNIKSKLRERKFDSEVFDKMTVGEFKTDTAGYGFLDKVDFGANDKIDVRLCDDVSAKFEKLMLERQEDPIFKIFNKKD